MIEITYNNLLFGGLLAVGATLVLQLALAIYMAFVLRRETREQTALARELFGLVRKIEGLTAHRREQMLKHYDGILDSLSTRIPLTVAAQTSHAIFEAESKILTRLAELEPDLKNDEASKRKMDELIKSMESLETTIVNLTSDTVRRVMAEGRRTLLDDEKYSDFSAAA